MFCTACDTRNPADARFCVHCGCALDQTQTTPAPVRPPTAAWTPPPAPSPPAYGPKGAAAIAGAPMNGLVQHIYVTMPPAHQAAPAMVAQPEVDSLLYLVLRLVWFLFVGLWLGQLWLMFAWLFNLTIIGLPIGLWMLNRLPQVMTLRRNPFRLHTLEGATYTRTSNGTPWVMRALYFVCIGWWFSLLWLQLAWLFAASLIGMPVAFLMFERTTMVTTLGE